MARFTSDEIQQGLKSIPNWRVENGEIVRNFDFQNFTQALKFVVRVGDAAEALGHHPDIDIRYTRVRLALVSHDAGGLTEMDFSLAANFDALYLASGTNPLSSSK